MDAMPLRFGSAPPVMTSCYAYICQSSGFDDVTLLDL
jgi:hypothetical protein